MNKYRALAKNTLIFGVGNALSKAIQFVMMPLYTTYMTTGAYGVGELLGNTVELLYPVMTLGIYEALFRFSLDREADHKSLLTNSLTLSAVGGGVACVCGAVLYALTCESLIFYTLFALLAQSFQRLAAHFSRGMGHIKAFSISGVTDVVVLCASGYLFIARLQLGARGYLLSIALGHLAGLLYLLIACRLSCHIGRPTLNRDLLGEMLKFSLPMVFNAMCWWLINLSGRYVVAAFKGADAAGLFVAASKIPAIINLATYVFQQAWQISSVEEFGADATFFARVFHVFHGLMTFLCGGVILLAPLVAKILLRGDFYGAWIFLPVLIFSAYLNAVSVYFGTLYNAAKQNKMIFVSTVVGAAINVGMSLLLVPRLGIWGACLGGALSYLLIVAVRIADTRRILQVPLRFGLLLLGVSLVALEAMAMSLNRAWSVQVAGALFVGVTLCFLWSARRIKKVAI